MARRRVPLPELAAVWTTLSAFGAAETDAALVHLLESLGALVDAQDGHWIGTVRLRDVPDEDPLYGWRPAAIRHLAPTPEKEAFFRDFKAATARGVIDTSTFEHARRAGRFRAVLLRDLVPRAWFDEPYYREVYAVHGITDTVWVVVPVGADAECYYGWNRIDRPAFTTKDRDLLADALAGVPWFHERLLLSYGLHVAERPLTPTERRVLTLLLTDRSEKQIADVVGLSERTTHHHVTQILRKFGVGSRVGLLALWLGHGTRLGPASDPAGEPVNS